VRCWIWLVRMYMLPDCAWGPPPGMSRKYQPLFRSFEIHLYKHSLTARHYHGCYARIGLGDL
jgi:hypothetical protein